MHCRAYNLTPDREYVFAPGRKFRFDFAWPADKVALEIDGGNFNGGHSRGKAYEPFCRKINLANDLGWRVYRATTNMATTGEAIEMMRKALNQ